MFKFAQLAFCRLDHRSGNASQRGDLYPVTLVCRPFLDGVQENDLFGMLDRVEMHVGEIGVFIGQQRKFEVVRGKQRQRAILLDEMATDGEGQRHPVESRCAAPDLVHQHQAVGRGVVQDGCRFGHLDHEG
ncbi:hypothetical protein SDC9_202752 [bioreactor metagenome]|uniref:Uncharacterized protein n=1 Tax=bioreactor metagenome TaxID=1076179 RepID=A0A645J6H5_9ZZZZ